MFLQIKTRPWIDLLVGGFWRAWRRWKAGTLSCRTTPKLSSTDQYWCVSRPCFDFWSFTTNFFRQKIDQIWRILVLFYHENDQKSKHGHEMHLYWSVDDNFSVVQQLRVSAFQRRQARQNPSNRRSIHGHVLICKCISHIRMILYHSRNAVRSRSTLQLILFYNTFESFK